MKKEFIQFLKDNKMLIPFIVNLAYSKYRRQTSRLLEHKWGNRSLSQLFQDISHTTYPIDETVPWEETPEMNWIDKAFPWEETPEERHRWANLSCKWIKSITKTKSK